MRTARQSVHAALLGAAVSLLLLVAAAPAWAKPAPPERELGGGTGSSGGGSGANTAQILAGGTPLWQFVAVAVVSAALAVVLAVVVGRFAVNHRQSPHTAAMS